MRIGILAAVCLLSIPLRAENPVKEGQDKFNLAVECIKRFEGWHGERKHWPYVGWGHPEKSSPTTSPKLRGIPF